MNRPKKTGLSRAEQLARLPQGFVCAIDDFSAYLKMELGRGPNTVSSYIGDVLQFCQSAVAEGKTSFLDVDADTISDWISDISKRVKTTTQSRKLSALATLANFLIDEGIWDKNFSQLVARPKVVRSQPEVLEAGQIDDIINAPDGGSAESVRDRAMLELAYSSGLRVSELCNLRESDIDYSGRVIRVKGKGEKTRLVPVGVPAIEAINAYRARRAELLKGGTCPELFVTRRGKKMSRKTFWFNIKKYGQKAGIDAHVKPHAMRHSFATHMLRNGANLFSIKEMLGHSDLSTTQIYTQLVRDDIANEYSAKHPRSKMDVEMD